MKELLTEWRKFVNEYEDVYDREQSYRNAIAKPDTTLDNLMNAVLKKVYTMISWFFTQTTPKKWKSWAAQRVFKENIWKI